MKYIEFLMRVLFPVIVAVILRRIIGTQHVAEVAIIVVFNIGFIWGETYAIMTGESKKK